MFLMAARVAPAADFPRQIVTSGLGYFPVAVRLRNGDVLAVIRGGAAHIGVKGRLDLVRSTDGGKTWSPPWTAIDGSLDDRNPAIGQLKDGAIVLAYAVAGNYDETGLHFKGGRTDRLFDGVYLTYSRDNGRTWSKSVRDPVIHKFYDAQGLVSPYGKIVQLPDGTAHLCAAGLAQRSAADPRVSLDRQFSSRAPACPLTLRNSPLGSEP